MSTSEELPMKGEAKGIRVIVIQAAEAKNAPATWRERRCASKIHAVKPAFK